MKKYLILFVFFLNLNLAFAQGGPPTGDDLCPCCEDMIDDTKVPPAPYDGMEDEYADCSNACLAGDNPCVPIDSSIIILVILGASLGIFKVYQNKKRQFEN